MIIILYYVLYFDFKAGCIVMTHTTTSTYFLYYNCNAEKCEVDTQYSPVIHYMYYGHFNLKKSCFSSNKGLLRYSSSSTYLYVSEKG